MEPTHVRLTIPDSVDPTLLMGPADSLLRRIEGAFDAMVTVRGNQVSVIGPTDVVDQVVSVFSRLIRCVEKGDVPTTEDVDLLIGQVSHGASDSSDLSDDILLTYRGRAIRPKTAGQKRYIDSIRDNTITFGIGPAGTGKTYLAMAMAVSALKRREVGRIVLARPVVEAGESLGYLPGTLQEKLDPYVRPLYDALFDMTDMEKGNALIEQGVIEIAPLAFMRGRTMNDAFVILDEAQNTTPDQMKMFLTRLGFGSKFVVTGDLTQRDLPGRNGLESARAVLGDVDDVSFVDLGRNDIVRHSLVAKIVDAYDRAQGAYAAGTAAGRETTRHGE
ncbi:PhoH family protein [Olsenella umbonata]|uniref:PhoH-like protein n=1 Tax=Parafannyhessea umbonata TaxID=604330 RepID=A0A7X9T9T3_9ACTN|nr:PhoH family protein [Parafannyhessea umbonata]NMF25490.1 PhoH family protein [Parafannyhessea umbonata]